MTKNIPIEAVMALTGLGPRTIYRLTREGRIPASIVGRRFVMTPAQLARLDRDGIAPKAQPVSFLRSIDRKAS